MDYRKEKWLNKIITYYPFNVPMLRKKYQNIWEADVPYVDRIKADLGIKGVVSITHEDGKLLNVSKYEGEEYIQFRKWDWDIETDFKVRGEEWEEKSFVWI